MKSKSSGIGPCLLLRGGRSCAVEFVICNIDDARASRAAWLTAILAASLMSATPAAAQMAGGTGGIGLVPGAGGGSGGGGGHTSSPDGAVAGDGAPAGGG